MIFFNEEHRKYKFNKYLSNTDSVPGPELAVRNQTKIPAYIIVREAVKESICVMQKKKRAAHFTQISPRRPLS